MSFLYVAIQFHVTSAEITFLLPSQIDNFYNVIVARAALVYGRGISGYDS